MRTSHRAVQTARDKLIKLSLQEVNTMQGFKPNEDFNQIL